MTKFTDDYITALKANETDAMVALITDLKTDEEKEGALAALIAAVEADKENITAADTVLENLRSIQDMNAKVLAMVEKEKVEVAEEPAAITDCAVSEKIGV